MIYGDRVYSAGMAAAHGITARVEIRNLDFDPEARTEQVVVRLVIDPPAPGHHREAYVAVVPVGSS